LFYSQSQASEGVYYIMKVDRLMVTRSLVETATAVNVDKGSIVMFKCIQGSSRP